MAGVGRCLANQDNIGSQACRKHLVEAGVVGLEHIILARVRDALRLPMDAKRWSTVVDAIMKACSPHVAAYDAATMANKFPFTPRSQLRQGMNLVENHRYQFFPQ